MGWIASVFTVIVIVVAWISGSFGSIVETKAAPIAQEVAKEQIRVHSLENEPRMQAVESLAQGNKQKLVDIERKMDDSLLIQRQILEEVRK